MMQQQNMNSQQQATMNQPPQVITTKDLSYLQDQMSWQLDAMKKCAHFAQECSDQDIKRAIEQAGQMHQRHYQMLLKHCQNKNTQQMQQVQQMMSQNQQSQNQMQ